jgi:hypothetical protein
MHAQRIIQDLLSIECPSIHAKRRACLAATVEAGSTGSLSLIRATMWGGYHPTPGAPNLQNLSEFAPHGEVTNSLLTPCRYSA